MAERSHAPSGPAKPGAVIRDLDAGVLTLTIDSVAKKNAITQAMYTALVDGLTLAAAAPDIRVVVLRGANAMFSSGNDLTDLAPDLGEAKPPSIRFIESMATFPKPIIAAVEGIAIGIGCTMLFLCDLVYASKTASLQLPFVNLGLTPEAGSSYLLPRMMGIARASELMLMGERFSAQTALDVGIVSAVVPDAGLADYVAARARTLAEKPPKAVRKTKALLRGRAEGGLMPRIAEETMVFAGCLAGAEFAEALSAFLEKRTPDFTPQDS